MLHWRSLPPAVRFTALAWLSGLAAFSICRIIFFITNYGSAQGIPAGMLVRSFVIGAQFDSVICCYILAVPFLLLCIPSILKRDIKLLRNTAVLLSILGFIIAFLIVCADMPYYKHFQLRITHSALLWMKYPLFVIRLVFGDIGNYPFLLVFAIAIIAFSRLVKGKLSKQLTEQATAPRIFTIAVFLLSFILLFFGMRGRFSAKSPIRWGTAYFSEYHFANQLGLNPVFTFVKSSADASKGDNNAAYMDDAKAMSIVCEELGCMDSLTRKITPSSPAHRYNVVFVLMESMSLQKMGMAGGNIKLTSFLDSLAHTSCFFDNFYSDGIHTFNGIFSTITGYPSLINKHPLEDIDHQYPSMASELSRNNYQTAFFTTHDEQFDNMSGFLYMHGFQKVFGEKDYPSEKVLSVTGVPDHVMFEESVKKLDELYKSRKPFFSMMLTGSDHEPYAIPGDAGFQATTGTKRQQIVEYADWSIKQFIHQCSTKPWFDSTIFVFTGDHGAIIQQDADMYLAMHHIPLIIYAPKIIKPAVIHGLGGQIDIYASIMGILGVPYTNRTFGKDIIHEQRKYLSFTYDNDLIGLTDGYFYVSRQESPALFQIVPEERFCPRSANKALADSLKGFAEATLQAARLHMTRR